MMTEACFKSKPRFFVLAGAIICAVGIFGFADTRITSLDPEVAAVQKAQHELRHENYRDALDGLVDATYKYPRNADIRYHLGLAYAGLNQQPTAISQYQSAVGLNPNHAGANYALGQYYAENHQWDQAQQTLSRLQRLCAAGHACTERDAIAGAIAKSRALQHMNQDQ